jgi:hypothetical protein
MNVVETVRRYASRGKKLTVSLSCFALAPFRKVQKQLGKNYIGGELYGEQLKRLSSPQSPAM